MVLTKSVLLLLACDAVAFPILLLAPVCVDGCEGDGDGGGVGHVALASITEPSGHVFVDGCEGDGDGGGVGHVALASITEPSGHVFVDGCEGDGDGDDDD
jgi:hypothetical protein